MDTYSVDGEDMEEFTPAMDAELRQLIQANIDDRNALSREQLQRMFYLKEMHAALEQQQLTEQYEQTHNDGQNNDDDANLDDDDQGARATTRHEDQDNWGLPPSPMKSHHTDDKLMTKLELRMKEMVKKEFFAHLDHETSSSGRENFVKAPKTGTNVMLSKAGENIWKTRTRNMFYAGPNSKSHDLSYCLSVHREISEKASLTSTASIDLLKRILQADPFKLVQNLTRGKCTVDRIYIYLQSTYKDSVSALKAAKLLIEFIDNPNYIDFGKVANRILELSLLAHSEESEAIALRSTSTTAITSLFSYINKYYPRAHSERVRRLHLHWTQRAMNTQELDAFYYLVDVGRTQLTGLLPSYANLKRQPTPNDQTPAKSNFTPRPSPYQPNYVNDVEGVEQDSSAPAHDQEEDQDLDFDEFDEVDSVDGTRRTYSKDPSQYKDHVRCKLCNGNSYVHSPPFFRYCSIYSSQYPSKVQCPTCLGFHQNLGRTPCMSPSAKNVQPRTPQTRPPNPQEAEKNPLTVFR